MNHSNPAEMESVLAADLGRAVMASQARSRAEKELPTLTKAELAELLFEQVGLNRREAKDMVETFFSEIRDALERGESITQIVQQLGHVAEGVSSAPALLALAERSGVEVPITAGVCKLITGQWTAQQAITALLDRNMRDEFEA